MGRRGGSYWWLSLIVAYGLGAFANHCSYVLIHDATSLKLMSFEQISYLAQIVASLGVIVSLIFVGLQIRQMWRTPMRPAHNAEWRHLVAERQEDGLPSCFRLGRRFPARQGLRMGESNK